MPIYMSSQDRNPGPYTCAAGTLPTEPPPTLYLIHPLYFSFLHSMEVRPPPRFGLRMKWLFLKLLDECLAHGGCWAQQMAPGASVSPPSPESFRHAVYGQCVGVTRHYFVVLPDPLTAPKFHVKKLSWSESMRVPEQFPVQRCLNLSAAVAVLGEAGLLKQVGPALPARTSLLCICLQRHRLELKRALFLWKMRRRLLGEWLGRFGLWLVSGSFRLSWRSAALILPGR